MTRNSIVSASKGLRFSDFAEIAHRAERHAPHVALSGIVVFALAMIMGVAILDYMMPASFGAAEQAISTAGQ